MGGNNFVSFITVQGFMLGLVFSVLKTDSAEGLLAFTLFITIFFYLFAHMSVAFYIKTMTITVNVFPMKIHEKDLDTIVSEISKREDFIDNASDIVDDAVKINKKATADDKKRELEDKRRTLKNR